MSLLQPPRFALRDHADHRVCLASASGATLELFVLEEDIVRVVVLPDGQWRHPKTWAIAPGAEDVPVDGRDRRDLDGYSKPAYTLEQDGGHLRIDTGAIRVEVALATGLLSWQVRSRGGWRTVLADRRTQAYNLGYWDARVYHYVRREAGEMYLGLGERAGSLNRARQRYEMRNIDAMGYDAAHTDPLYKHIPFYLTWQPGAQSGYGLFYDTVADCSFDMGRELDNYHGPYRYFVAEHGDLDYYFIASPDTPLHAVRRFTWLTGRPALMPRWGLGYSGSTMTYTDAPDACVRMGEFIARCREHDILCDSFHLSSGYTSIGAKRYVFNWNRDKFPDIRGFVDGYLAHGVKLCANIKPCLLRDHPEFDAAQAAGLLIRAHDGAPAWVQFWDEVGAYLDFTHPATLQWWKDHVKAALLDFGIAATWNDNNEFEIWTPDAVAHGFGHAFPAREAKVLQTTLMMRASRDAQREHAPHLRPFLVSRSGGVGMQRYVQTWSGDNFTSWETLRYNLKMGLGLSLSGVSNIGHDIGGFSGPAPSPELFARWVAFGVFMPRFSIHSWNDDGTVNEPWMHPEVTRDVSRLIKLRYRLLPYLYDLLWQSANAYEPVLRPTFAGFPHDARCYEDSDDMMVGAALLVAPVVEPGCSEREVYLPQGARWTSYWSGETLEGGQSVRVPAPLTEPPMLIREGHAIALNLAEQHFDHRAERRGFLVAPYAGTGIARGRCVEDDGVSEAWRTGSQGHWQLAAESCATHIALTVTYEGDRQWRAPEIDVLIPAGETRPVQATHGRLCAPQPDGAWQRYTLTLDA
jgi:alpha-glucosidase